jgi:hypothetical protein
MTKQQGLASSDRLSVSSISLISNFAELKYRVAPRSLMTLTLNLSPELEQYLLQEASQQGLSVEAVALQLLTTSISLKQKQTEAVSLLQSRLNDGDAFWQRATPTQRAEDFRAWVAELPETHLSLSEEAFDRGNIYE